MIPAPSIRCLLIACVAGLGLAAPPLPAQTELRGEVVEVDGYRARIELESERPPAIGDAVTLSQETAGLGEVAIAGDWRVTEIDEDGGIWMDPHARAPRPEPGHAAVVVVGGLPARPELPPPTYSEDFNAGERPELETDACQAAPYAGGYALAHTGGVEQPCRLAIPEAGRVGPGTRIAVTASVIDTEEEDEPYGIVVGLADADATDYLLFVLTPAGGYAAARWTGESAEVLVDPTRHPAIHGGPAATNRIAIEIDEDAVHSFVNGVYMGAVEVAVPEGLLGLNAGFAGLGAVFDDLVVGPVAP